MRNCALWAGALAGLLAGCGPAAKTSAPEAVRAEAPRPADESRRFPKANLVGTEVVSARLLGQPFMPGGTLARYQKGRKAYQMFVAKLPSATDAAVLLPDWQKALAGAKLVPSFGGYFGQNDGRPVFVFAKGAWIAGVAGLPEAEADAQARLLAARLD